MGTCKVDFYSKRLETERVYSYLTKEGVTAILENYDMLRAMAESGRGEASEKIMLLVDTAAAAKATNVLTARQRQILALIYRVGCTLSEAAQMLGVKDASTIAGGRDSAIKRLVAFLSGGELPGDGRPRLEVLSGGKGSGIPQEVRGYLEALAFGDVGPLEVPDNSTIEALQEYLAETDARMAQGLMERDHPTHEYQYADSGEEYPYLSERQQKRRAARERSYEAVEIPLRPITRTGKRSAGELYGGDKGDENFTPRKAGKDGYARADFDPFRNGKTYAEIERWKGTERYKRGVEVMRRYRANGLNKNEVQSA